MTGPVEHATRETAALSDWKTTQHQAHHAYSYRMPSPPRIVVPPPTLNTRLPNLNFIGASNHGEIRKRFLGSVNLQNIVNPPTTFLWTYERRREAQMVLPILYLGPMMSAKDAQFIETEGITMAIAVRARESSMRGALQAARGLGIEVAAVDAPTYPNLISRFAETTRLINEHLERVYSASAATGKPRMGKVLIFCESGNERSAAVVAAYLMEVLEKCDHVTAMQICQARRFCVSFEDPIKNILQAYSDILSARRAVSACNSPYLAATTVASDDLASAPLSNGTSRKRTMGEFAEDRMDIDSEPDLDVLRFKDRDLTPFMDPES